MKALLTMAARFSLDGPAWLPRQVRRVPLQVLAGYWVLVWRVRLMRRTH